MKKKSSIPLSKPFSGLFKRFHLTIFFVFIVGCLIGGVILINKMVSEGETEGSGYSPSISAGSIDQATLQRIQALHPSTDPAATLALPTGRINPFGE